jgi:hypothetical protein
MMELHPLTLLAVAVAFALVVIVARTLAAKRTPRRPRRSLSTSAPVAPVLSAKALSVLRLAARQAGQSISTQDVRDLLGSTPLGTAEVIDELRQGGVIDWFGESGAVGGHGYVSAKGKRWLERQASGA